MTKRVYIDAHQFKGLVLFLRDFKMWHITGAHSISVPSHQVKFILRSACVDWPTAIEGEHCLMTPGEAARIELDRAFPGHKKTGWFKGHIKLFDLRPPMFCRGPYKGEMYYVDIRSAYWQVYRALWLDTRYPKGMGYEALHLVGDKLSGWKAARNAVIGICRARGATGWKGHKPVHLATTNRYLAPELWATVQDVLQSLAEQAGRGGGVEYINTDGYIFSTERGYQNFTTILKRWAVAYTTEVGDGEIYSWGHYRVGNKHAGTETFNPICRPLSNLHVEHPGILDWWLKQKERVPDGRTNEIAWNAGIRRSFVYPRPVPPNFPELP